MAQRQWRSDDTSTWNEAFGNGSDGSSYSAPAIAGCSGTSGGTSLTLSAASSFANGNLVLIHQSRGDNSNPNWELNKISSGGGGTSLTMAYPLTRTYTDSGASQAQIIEMKQYTNISTGSVTPTAWNGSQGGIFALFANEKCTVNGTINLDGAGFVKGTGSGNANILGRQGGGYPNENLSQSTSANGNGGGGGATGSNNNGAGGGNGTSGTSSGGGTGGAAVGNAALTTMLFGGGGGGTSCDSGGTNGGDGGGMVFIFAKEIEVTGTITADGEAGGHNGITGNDGGSGAGGSILFKGEVIDLGTSLVGAVGTAGAVDGGTGRIHADYSTSITGTTSPTIDTTLDATIITPASGSTGYAFFM